MTNIIFQKILFVIFSLFISVLDIVKGAIPRVLFIFVFITFFVVYILTEKLNSLTGNFLGAFSGLTVFILAYFLSHKKLGLADIWYSALIGFVVGPYKWFASIAIACIAGVVFILATKKNSIPFIPFMAIGSIITCITKG